MFEDHLNLWLKLNPEKYVSTLLLMNKAAFDKLSPADQKVFLDAAKLAAAATRARVDKDDASGVADLRAKGMNIIETFDKSAFVARLAPVFAQFEKEFGKDKIDAIRNYK
jgi:TRAP-type C4-dicarboxylate transport system substrate-binding protein